MAPIERALSSLVSPPGELMNDRLGQNLFSLTFLGVRVDCVTMEKAMALMLGMARSGKPHHVVTVNPEFVMIAQTDMEFRQVLSRASLALPDGIGLLWAARSFGQKLPERVTGVDTVMRFAGIARDNGISFFLLGAFPGVARRVGQLLQEKYPGLRIAGTYAGSPHPDEEDRICSLIEAARPDVLLVAYGSPQQELWIARTAARLRIPVAIGVGGAFDYIAGVVKRCPEWMQHAGLEWTYRLVQQPSRWRRMLRLPRFALAILRDQLRNRRKP